MNLDKQNITDLVDLHTKVFRLGFRAYHKGRLPKSNPFDIGLMKSWWEEGFAAAKNDEREHGANHDS